MPRPLLVVVGACALALLASAPASAKVVWLCKPGMADNPCEPSLQTTRFSAWGAASSVVTPRRAKRPPVDCFYVYPTVSDQQTTLAAKTREPAVRDIALFQAARYSQVCRVFAPVYRQLTVPGLGRVDATAGQLRTAQGDVVEAWRTYLRRHNHGRGVVLIGHSQGAYQLQELIRNEVEPKRSVRRRLVSALLLGGNVTVRKGRDGGGVFKRLRACRAARQLGCVVAFSTFNRTPPADARFGRTGAFRWTHAPRRGSSGGRPARGWTVRWHARWRTRSRRLRSRSETTRRSGSTSSSPRSTWITSSAATSPSSTWRGGWRSGEAESAS